MILEKSEHFKSEYCASVVRIGEIIPLEGYDLLGYTIVCGFKNIVRLDLVKEGDVMIYASHETLLNPKFLSHNNLYSLKFLDLNKNVGEIQRLLESGKKIEAKSRCGFFESSGRLKMTKFKGTTSLGYLFKVEELQKWKPELQYFDASEHIGEDFDMVCGELFISPYIKPRKGPSHPLKKHGHTYKACKRLERYKALVPGEFQFHYETLQLQRSVSALQPTDKIDMSVKMNGTSVIVANVKRKYFRSLSWPKRFINFIAWCLKKEPVYKEYDIDYGTIISSRTNIKNQDIVGQKVSGYFTSKIHEKYGAMLGRTLEKGMTIYGEICGHLPGSNSCIWENYDYGCKTGDNFVTIYRITSSTNSGKYEWEIKDIKEWVKHTLSNYPELEGILKSPEIIKSGRICDLYPNIDYSQPGWRNILIQEISTDPELGLEELEPLCKKEVPREGVCIRIAKDTTPRCFKIKGLLFKEYEEKLVNSGETSIEEMEEYL